MPNTSVRQTLANEHIRRTLNATSYTVMSVKLGLGASYLSMIFAGKRVPTVPVFEKLAKHLGVSMDDLYGYIRQASLDKRRKGSHSEDPGDSE